MHNELERSVITPPALKRYKAVSHTKPGALFPLSSSPCVEIPEHSEKEGIRGLSYVAQLI